MSATASSSNLVGFTLEDRYRIVREIGRGGMGIVYEAEHTQLGKRVAIKLMLDKYTDDTEAVARFRREALAASTIGNSHIIDVSHIGKAPDGRPFVVMELLLGLPLSQVIEGTGPMTHWRAIAIMRQVLRAVGAAHAKGIVHRDLKPDNIFLVEQDDQRDFVKLLDFGISKMMDGDAAIAHTKLTTTGMVMGTPLYMAPEQAMGTAVDHRADIYACGVILYEMLSGRPPFEGATYPVLIAKLLTAEPTPILERVPGLPARLVAAVHRALEKDPERRWQSCEAFNAALPVPSTPSQMELAGTMGVGPTSLQMERVALPTPPGVRASRKGRNALWIALAAGAGVAVAGVAAYVATRPPSGSAVPAIAAAPPPAPPGLASGAASSVTRVELAAAPADAAVKTAPTGWLHVETKPAEAAILIDGKTEVTSNSKAVLEVGEHTVRAEAPGYKLREQKTTIAEGEVTRLELVLERAPAVRPPVHGPGSAHNPIVTGPGSATIPHDAPPVHTEPPVHTAPPPPPPSREPPPPHGTSEKPNPY